MSDTGIGLVHFTYWLASGERGISSEAIVSQLTGHPVGQYSRRGYDHPRDPADFRRCELLLSTHPLARLAFPEAMPSRSPEWAALVPVWDELHELLESEVPGYLNGGRRSDAPKTYARMKEVLDSARSTA